MQKTVYKCFIRSQVEYCCPIWMGGGDSFLTRLDRVQVRAIRLIGHTEGVKLQSLGHRRGVAALCVMHRLLNGRAPAPLYSLVPTAAAARRSSARLGTSPALQPPDIRKPAFWLRSCIPLLTTAWDNQFTPIFIYYPYSNNSRHE